MTFGNALRKFMNCTDTKQTQLAEHLGYDVSYISRWLSDSKLPSIRGNSSFFVEIIRFILKDCSDNCRNALCSTFEISPNLSDNDFENKCISILANAYKESQGTLSKTVSRPLMQMTNNCTLSQLDISFDYNNSLLADLTSKMASYITAPTLECISIPFTSDYGNNECIPFWMNILQELSPETHLRLRMLADISDSDYHINICRDICSFYGALKGNMSVEFYNVDRSTHSYESLLVFKNGLCVITYHDTLLGAKNVLITQDSILTDRYYGTVNYLLRGQFPLIETSSLYTLYNRKFFQNFFTSPEFFSLHTAMPLFFVSLDPLKSALMRSNIPDQLWDFYDYYEKTISRWTVLIYKSAIINFLFDGAVNLFFKTVTLTNEERRNYLLLLISKLKEGNRLLIIDDTNPVISKEQADFSLFLNNRSMLLFQHDEEILPNIHHSSNDGIVTCFYHLITALTSLPNPLIMCADDVIAFLYQSLEL